ncbi:MAG: sugar phosphate isomerase/epimerase [Candidatus Hydrogenedentes bacterium]|nr:sugar phosphate isomerase/epimerase [Candidatus Hydrogenedentota bacterium]
MDERVSPPGVGMAVWLLDGGRLVDRIAWLIESGFGGVSFLQTAVDVEKGEREEAAAAIAEAGLWATYHGNVHHKLTDSGGLDADFANRMLDDVIWWHEHTNGIHSCCSDSINTGCDPDLNQRHIEFMAGRLGGYGIRVGVENGYGEAHRFTTLADIGRFRQTCSGPEIGMLLDAGHANIHVRSDGVDGEDDMGAYIGQLPFDVLEVHFSDNRGQKDEHKALGYGNLDVDAVLRALKGKGFTGKLTVEVCPDILSGDYRSSITDPVRTDGLLRSRDKIAAAWASIG